MLVYYENKDASKGLGQEFYSLLTKLNKNNRQIITLCIGTDRSTGDCLAPYIGTELTKKNINNIITYGTLDNPVHAGNLEEKIEEINKYYNNPFIVAIDASLGKSENIGLIKLNKGSLSPGCVVGKNLPKVGDINIIGVVNVNVNDNSLNQIIIQNTRLSLVVNMANIVAESIELGMNKYNKRINQYINVFDKWLVSYVDVDVDVDFA